MSNTCPHPVEMMPAVTAGDNRTSVSGLLPRDFKNPDEYVLLEFSEAESLGDVDRSEFDQYLGADGEYHVTRVDSEHHSLIHAPPPPPSYNNHNLNFPGDMKLERSPDPDCNTSTLYSDTDEQFEAQDLSLTFSKSLIEEEDEKESPSLISALTASQALY